MCVCVCVCVRPFARKREPVRSVPVCVWMGERCFFTNKWPLFCRELLCCLIHCRHYSSRPLQSLRNLLCVLLIGRWTTSLLLLLCEIDVRIFQGHNIYCVSVLPNLYLPFFVYIQLHFLPLYSPLIACVLSFSGCLSSLCLSLSSLLYPCLFFTYLYICLSNTDSHLIAVHPPRLKFMLPPLCLSNSNVCCLNAVVTNHVSWRAVSMQVFIPTNHYTYWFSPANTPSTREEGTNWWNQPVPWLVGMKTCILSALHGTWLGASALMAGNVNVF